jgi:maltose O-acetyltransferase
MGDFIHRAMTAALASEFLPVTLRMRLMRRLGFDVSPTTCIWAGASLRSKKLKTGSEVFINVGFFYDGYDELRIGNNVRIGQFVRAITATHEIGPSNQRGLVEVVGKPIEIQDGCWIGAAVTLLPGVTIARGCVLAAGSIVTKSTEPNGLYGGNPARLIRALEP